MSDSRSDRKSRDRVKLLRNFVAKHGWNAFSSKTVVDGVRLGLWVTRRRGEFARGTLAEWLRLELEAVPGWEWDPNRARHERHLDAVRDYVEQTGTYPRRGEVTVDGADLNKWLHGCRRRYRSGNLPDWLQHSLESLPNWDWHPPRGRFPAVASESDRTPRQLIAAAAEALDKSPTEVIDELERLVYWLDKETEAKRTRLPRELRDAQRVEGRGRPRWDVTTG